MRAKPARRARTHERPQTHATQGTVDWLATSEIAWGAPHAIVALLVAAVLAWRAIAGHAVRQAGGAVRRARRGRDGS